MRVQGSGGEEGGWGAIDACCTGWTAANDKSEREAGGEEGRESEKGERGKKQRREGRGGRRVGLKLREVDTPLMDPGAACTGSVLSAWSSASPACP